MGRYQQPKLLHFGIDLLKASIDFGDKGFYKSKLKKLGLSENSNIIYLNKNIGMLLEPNEISNKFSHYYKFFDIKTNTTLGFILIAKTQKLGAVKLNDIIEITGQGLVLYKYSERLKLFTKLGFEIMKFKRVDICFDINLEVAYLFKIFKEKLKGKTTQTYTNKGVVTGFYIGKTKKDENTYQLLRVYDKHLDNRKKGKKWLYPFYSPYKFIARLEIEIRKDKACFLDYKKLLDDNYIFSIIVKTWYGYNNTFFNFLKMKDFKEVKDLELSRHKKRLELIQRRKENFIKYGIEFLNEEEEYKIVKTFISYAKKLFNNGYNLDKILQLFKNNQLGEEKSDLKSH